MHGIVPRPTAQKFMTPSCHGDHAYSVGRVFLLWNSRQHTDRASASVEFETKLKMEEKRQAGKRALAFPFIPKWVDYSAGLVPLNLLEKAGPFLEGYCLMSQRFERKYLLVDLFFLPCLHTSQSSPLCLWFLNLIFTFSKCFVVFTKRNILWAVISWL